MAVNDTPIDLERLILEPVETIAVEYKDWLDLRSTEHKAKLAKELIALRNSGGGHLVLGFADPDMRPRPRPDEYEYVDTDYVNGIVARYADPPFHCGVHLVRGHVVLAVPAGVTVPVRSKRAGPNNEIAKDSYYIRRPGPNSEPPQSGLEWDSLLRLCIGNREDELEELVRRIVRLMNTPGEELPVPSVDRIEDLLK